MSKLHGDKGLTREACNGPRLIIDLDPSQFHVNLSLNKVPLVVVERHGRAESHIYDAVADHEYKGQIMGGWEKKNRNENNYSSGEKLREKERERVNSLLSSIRMKFRS